MDESIDRVEPRGKSGDERAFVVTVHGNSSVVFRNEAKDLARCVSCTDDPGGCEHIQLLDAYLSIELYCIDWQNTIAYVLINWNRTNWRRLWGMVSNGLLFRGHPLRAQIRAYHHSKVMPMYHKHGLGGTPGGSEAIKKRWRTDPELKPVHEEYERLKSQWRDAVVYAINFHLDHMTIPEIAYLKMTFMPEEMKEIDEDLLSPSWHNADIWADENNIFMKALDDGVLDFTPVDAQRMPKGLNTA